MEFEEVEEEEFINPWGVDPEVEPLWNEDYDTDDDESYFTPVYTENSSSSSSWSTDGQAGDHINDQVLQELDEEIQQHYEDIEQEEEYIEEPGLDFDEEFGEDLEEFGEDLEEFGEDLEEFVPKDEIDCSGLSGPPKSSVGSNKTGSSSNTDGQSKIKASSSDAASAVGHLQVCNLKPLKSCAEELEDDASSVTSVGEIEDDTDSESFKTAQESLEEEESTESGSFKTAQESLEEEESTESGSFKTAQESLEEEESTESGSFKTAQESLEEEESTESGSFKTAQESLEEEEGTESESFKTAKEWMGEEEGIPGEEERTIPEEIRETASTEEGNHVDNADHRHLITGRCSVCGLNFVNAEVHQMDHGY